MLFSLLKKKGTGVLTVSREPLTRKFFFIGGALVELELSPEDAGFGAFLAQKNLIDSTELKAYVDREKEGAADLRSLFIKMGCLTPWTFQEEHMHFLHDRLVECFSWKAGTILFELRSSVTMESAAAAFTPVLFYLGFSAHLDPAAKSSSARLFWYSKNAAVLAA